jgi:glyoxylase-like metal-dependent hydrolase (beta-lactamase superfamily II)
MFTGDNVLGIGTAVFTNLHVYLQSLERMKATTPQRLYPAHG